MEGIYSVTVTADYRADFEIIADSEEEAIKECENIIKDLATHEWEHDEHFRSSILGEKGKVTSVRFVEPLGVRPQTETE